LCPDDLEAQGDPYKPPQIAPWPISMQESTSELQGLATGNTRTITITGTIKSGRSLVLTNLFVPVRRAQVALVSGDVAITSPTWTSDNGTFSFKLTLANEQKITVRLYSINQKARVVPPNDNNSVYCVDLKTVTVNPSKTFWNLGTMRFWEGSYIWNMLNAVVDVSEWLKNKVGWERSEVTIKYPQGKRPGYVTGKDYIEMPEPSFLDVFTPEFLDGVIYHEYGHAVLWSIYGIRVPHGPTLEERPDLEEHSVHTESGKGFAFNEGFAYFLEQAVRRELKKGGSSDIEKKYLVQCN